MKCVVCKTGQTKPGMATVTMVREKTTVVFRNVPAQVCENCGEEYVCEIVTGELLETAEAAVAIGVEVDVRHYVAA
jgi:YgiT-type zinc finger domain-containing protein